MNLQNIIDENINNTENLNSQIDEKIEYRKNKRRRLLKWAGITTTASLSILVYDPVCAPMFEAFLKTRQEIRTANQLFDNYNSELQSILEDGIITEEENNRLPILSENLNNLENRYEQLDISRDLSPIRNKISEIVNIKLDQLLDTYNYELQSFFDDSIVTEEEYNKLPTLSEKLNNLEGKYSQLGVSKDLSPIRNKISEIVNYNKQKVEFYTIKLRQVNDYVNSKKYSLVVKKIRNLASILESENFPSSNKVLNRVKNFSYFEFVKLDAQYETRKISDGYWEEEWIPEKKVKIEKEPRPSDLIILIPLIGKVYGLFKILEGDKYETILGHYEKEWIDEPQYEKVLAKEAHFKRIQVFPYSGKQIIVKDFIPIKK